jgi:hypothetical protein
MKLNCFAGLNCPKDYECLAVIECEKALSDELESVPIEVWRIIEAKLYEEKMLHYCRNRVKTWAWETRIKK